MSNAVKRVRARVTGRHLELLEDVSLPAGEVVNIAIEMAGTEGSAAQLRALEESAGAWTDEGHPELTSREDVLEAVRGMREAFERPYA